MPASSLLKKLRLQAGQRAAFVNASHGWVERADMAKFVLHLNG